MSGTAGLGALAQPQALGALAAADVVFPLIHGRGGEDGTLQGLLELAEVPYVGAGVAASAIGMDKELLKRLFAERGLPVVPLRVVTREAWERDRAEVRRAANELPYPLFVKPANGGSSVGITKVPAAQELDAAITMALQHDHKALVEQGAVGRELECGVLGNTRPEASPVGEIRYRREFYDYAAKYEDEGTELIVPADLPADVARQVQSLGLRRLPSDRLRRDGAGGFLPGPPGAALAQRAEHHAGVHQHEHVPPPVGSRRAPLPCPDRAAGGSRAGEASRAGTAWRLSNRRSRRGPRCGPITPWPRRPTQSARGAGCRVPAGGR